MPLPPNPLSLPWLVLSPNLAKYAGLREGDQALGGIVLISRPIPRGV